MTMIILTRIRRMVVMIVCRKSAGLVVGKFLRFSLLPVWKTKAVTGGGGGGSSDDDNNDDNKDDHNDHDDQNEVLAFLFSVPDMIVLINWMSHFEANQLDVLHDMDWSSLLTN